MNKAQQRHLRLHIRCHGFTRRGVRHHRHGVGRRPMTQHVLAIRSKEEGGSNSDPENLQALCKQCAREAQFGAQAGESR